MTVEFYSDKHGRECVKLTNGKKYMDAYIEIKSKNGRFSAIADVWYEDVPFVDEDGDPDVSPEDIEDSETLVVFDQNAVAYTIKGIYGIDEDNAILHDDGTIALFDDDDHLIVHTLTGKKIRRKPPYSVTDTHLDENIAWFWGDDGYVTTEFTIFRFDTLTSWTRRLPQSVGDIKDISLQEDGFIYVQYEAYDEKLGDELGIAKYALDGKKIGDVKYPKPKKQKAADLDTSEHNEEPAPIKPSAPSKSSKPKSRKRIIWFWLIIILVVVTIVRCSR